MNGGRSESFPGNIPMISRLSQTGPTGPVMRVAPPAGGCGRACEKFCEIFIARGRMVCYVTSATLR